MTFALFGARTTYRNACFDRGLDDTEVGLGLTGHHAADCVAEMGAVGIESDRLDQLQCVRLAEAGVGTGITRGGTVEALVNPAEEQGTIKADRPRMPLDDFL